MSCFQSFSWTTWVSPIHVNTQRAVWDLGSSPPCRSILSAFRMWFRVRSTHVQLRDGHRSLYIVLWSLSWTCFSSWESFLLLVTLFLVFWWIATALVFLVMHFLQLCLLLGPSSERSQRKEWQGFLSHSWIYGSSVQREAFLPSELEAFSELLLLLCQGLGQEREKNPKDFPNFFWPIIGHFLLIRQERQGFSWNTFCMHLSYFWISCCLWVYTGKKVDLKERETHPQFSGSQRSVCLAQWTCYHFLFKVLR